MVFYTSKRMMASFSVTLPELMGFTAFKSSVLVTTTGGINGRKGIDGNN
jgi:hypothetical protein